MDHRLNSILQYLNSQQKKYQQYLAGKEKPKVLEENYYKKFLEEANNFHHVVLDPLFQTAIEPIEIPSRTYGDREPYQAAKAHLISHHSMNHSSSASKHRDDYKIEDNRKLSISQSSMDKVFHDVRDQRVEAQKAKDDEVAAQRKEKIVKVYNKIIENELEDFSKSYWQNWFEFGMERFGSEFTLIITLWEALSQKEELNRETWFVYWFNGAQFVPARVMTKEELVYRKPWEKGKVFNGWFITPLNPSELRFIGSLLEN